MSRAVHIGDLHSGPGERRDDRFRALAQIIREALALPDLAVFLIPGDLNDARMSIEDRNHLKEQLKVMADRAPVVITPGNHDLPGDLDIFADLKARWPIYVVNTPQVIRVALATGGHASIFAMRYPTKAGLVAQGVAPGSIITEAAAALDGIFLNAAYQIHEARLAGDYVLMISHVNVAGSKTSVGQPNIGREIEITPSQLTCFDDRLAIVYPGSVCRLDWGEIDPKGYVVVDLERGNPFYVGLNHIHKHQSFGSREGWTFQPIDVPPMYHVEAELTRDGFFWQVKDGPQGEVLRPPLCGCTQPIEGSWTDLGFDRIVPYRFGESLSASKTCTCCKGTGVCWRGVEVRVRYTFKQSEKSVLNDAALLAEFADALRLVVEPVAVPDRALRSPAVAAARSLAEKITAWCEVSGHVATESLLSKLARLEHGDHVQLLTEVQADLAAIEVGERELVSA
jgi:3',5'-cyclic AMP phosphodiesterase CpdA